MTGFAGRALLALVLLGTTAAAPPRRLPPIDQCKSDASFSAFRASLARVVAKKDRAALAGMLAPDVLVNFGGATGRQAFADEWSFDPSEYGNVWDQFARMLKMGCARDGGSRIIPSLSMQVEQDVDEEWVVVLPGARLHKEAGIESVNPKTVPWVVAIVTSRASDTMTGVRLPDGREGFIADEQVYEPAGYRMIAEKRGGKWMITAFVAGD